MSKHKFNNRLNDLTPKEWLKFQKSWFLHNPPARSKQVLRHPAKFPETLVKEFIEFFTKRGQVVFDPMVGTGSTLIAALQANRHSYGVEINPEYADIARSRVENERQVSDNKTNNVTCKVITGDAQHLPQIIATNNIPLIDYVITSPPYWNMLHAYGAHTQKTRRNSNHLDLYYSDDPHDLGNINDYHEFLERLTQIYSSLKPYIKKNAYLTIIVKNIKKRGEIYPLAWDLAFHLRSIFALKDEKIWVQDNQPLFPFGIGNAWVSNTFHHYCLQFRNQ